MPPRRAGRQRYHRRVEFQRHVGERVFFSLVHHRRQFGGFGAQPIGDLPPLLAGGFGGALSKGGGDESGGDATAALAGVGQDIAHEMRPAAPPCGAENVGYGGFDALMSVGNDQLDAFQPAALELAQGVDPEKPAPDPTMACTRSSTARVETPWI